VHDNPSASTSLRSAANGIWVVMPAPSAVGVYGATMRHAPERAERLLQDGAARPALHVGEQPDAARVPHHLVPRGGFYLVSHRHRHSPLSDDDKKGLMRQTQLTHTCHAECAYLSMCICSVNAQIGRW
jgi:hypothetical protein